MPDQPTDQPAPPDLPRDERILFVDIESTGLNNAGPGGLHNGGALLEVGLMLTDADLNVIATCARTILHGPRIRALREAASDVVQTMHGPYPEGTNLWSDCEFSNRAHPVDVAEDALLGFLTDFGVRPGTLPMGGSSVHTDRDWLKVHMPRLERHFHYRNIDVSSVKELVRRWIPEPDRKAGAPEPAMKHRAIDDLRDTVAELTHYRRLLAPQAVGGWARSA